MSNNEKYAGYTREQIANFAFPVGLGVDMGSIDTQLPQDTGTTTKPATKPATEPTTEPETPDPFNPEKPAIDPTPKA